jgi:malate synthase
MSLSLLLGVLGGCASVKPAAEDFGPRFEAASRIKNVEAHDAALTKIADDAMAEENAGATSWAVSQITDSKVRDGLAEKAANHFASSGRKDVASAIAESISDDARRDRVMQKLAETPVKKEMESP